MKLAMSLPFPPNPNNNRLWKKVLAQKRPRAENQDLKLGCLYVFPENIHGLGPESNLFPFILQVLTVVSNCGINKNQRPESGHHAWRRCCSGRGHGLFHTLDPGQNGVCFVQTPLRHSLIVINLHSDVNQSPPLPPAMCWSLEQVVLPTWSRM